MGGPRGGAKEGAGQARRGGAGGRGQGGAGQPTYLVEELGQLYLHLLPLEHVVLGLLADGRDEVELPGHGVGLLRMHTGPWMVPVGQGSRGCPRRRGQETGNSWRTFSPPAHLCRQRGDALQLKAWGNAQPSSEPWVWALVGWGALGKELAPLCLSISICEISEPALFTAFRTVQALFLS